MDGRTVSWAEVAPTLPERAVAGFGTVDLVREDRAPRAGWRVRLSGPGEIRVEDADGRLVGIVGPPGSLLSAGTDDAGWDDEDDPVSTGEGRLRRPAELTSSELDEEAAEHIRLLLAPRSLGEGFTTDNWLVAEGLAEEGRRVLEVTEHGEEGGLRIVVDTANGLVLAPSHVPDPDRFHWAVTSGTPDDHQDPALCALPGGVRHVEVESADWAFGFSED